MLAWQRTRDYQRRSVLTRQSSSSVLLAASATASVYHPGTELMVIQGWMLGTVQDNIDNIRCRWKIVVGCTDDDETISLLNTQPGSVLL